MKLIDKLQSLSQSRLLSEEEVAHLVKMHSLYRIGSITFNELRIGLGGESIGVAGDQYVSEDQRVLTYSPP